ncbi:PTS system D-fructose-specific IIB component (F1P-forming), Frc family /PTS system D-fructose-specific IIC component (F1P-forming), Frc family [Granulicatella balaenopterae]|uniref:PTS system D-fructose-specific IIB component (F1P-forming), Frc family /PTS system D-fructose-specific IIC component (F1P-forming), Frc family n=1 Tax=Granulicatella balaenopterae TaxID=137733 RepID=A0A1H9N4S8_9LACT|nr:PTS fructose transporter subunit IIBC [Granulicatella balaenopterae]SER31060.1 PTS system D-fructose-specific IIB component (F1P-forming), Frc family /PTS system D-fructose-specific IIC component (F1P-forming), Frc family [Granulicatella balaenopterae]
MKKYDIIAATGCPTGIAHTFMAQEALEQAAKKCSVSIKVETHGQIGIENELTEEEIKNAKAVIIAADKDVHAERFVGKKIIEVSVGQGIKDAEKLIEAALNGEGEIRYPTDSDTKTIDIINNNHSTGNIGHDIYKHLMNGVSHMLPFVVGGGVLIAISFLFGIYSFDPASDQFNPFAAQLKEIGGFAMGMMTPILAAYIAESIGKRPALVTGFVAGVIANAGGAGFLGGIIGGFLAGYVIILLEKLLKNLPKTLDGLKAIFLYPLLGIFITGMIMNILVSPMASINESMMQFLANFEHSNPLLLGIIVGCMCAFDMGGPVNKAAYVTGTALLAQGNTTFMAGVSAACITPPLITGVATLVYKNRFTSNERNAGLVNIILGCTHITEGAIPFVAEDPLHAMPIMMAGSSVAAVLTYLFKVQVPAPHGGFLVLPVVTHPLLWVLAIAIGSVVGGLLLGMSKKKK